MPSSSRLTAVLLLTTILGATAARAQTTAPSADAQPGDIRADFRSGQTFVTWSEIEGANIKYRVYRSTSPIESIDQLTSDTLLATVPDYTSFNWMASIDRRNANGPELVIEKKVYYSVQDDAEPLADDTGLFVHTAKTAEKAWYAVTAIIDDMEMEKITPGANATANPVDEKVERPQPVRQPGKQFNDFVHWTDNVGTDVYPAMSSIPSVPYIFRVKVPEGEGPFALVGVLHGSTIRYSGPDDRLALIGAPPQKVKDIRVQFDSPNMNRGVRIKDFDPFPLIPGGWYGYRSSWGTGANEDDGELVDYHARRVLWMLDWAKEKYPVDPERVALEGASMGGIGSLLIAMKYPERFSSVRSTVPPLGISRSMRESFMRTRESASTAASRPAEGRSGRSFRSEGASSLSTMMPIVPFDFVEDNPAINYPYITIVAGRTDTLVRFRDKVEFAQLAQEKKLPFQLIWHAGGHGGGQAPEDLPTTRTISAPDLGSFRINQSFPAIANSTLNDDPGTVDLAVPPERRPAWDAPGVGDLVGSINGQITWDRASIVDEADRYEITLRIEEWAELDQGTADVTPRRVQNFKTKPGEKVYYQVLQGGEGSVEADEHGFVTVKNVPLTREGTRLLLSKKLLAP